MNPFVAAIMQAGGQYMANRETSKSTAKQINFQERQSLTVTIQALSMDVRELRIGLTFRKCTERS